MLHRIVVATDGSANARRAEVAAGELAAATGANLVIAHSVVERPSDEELGGLAEVMRAIGPQPFAPLHMDNLVEQVTRATGAEHIYNHQDALREIGERLLYRASQRAQEAGATHVETRLVYGAPAETIVQAAEHEEADLVVVGTRGLCGLRGRLLGSVSSEVVKRARADTLVVKE
jgi:nucleotide-binding universal stress UspA family protein